MRVLKATLAAIEPKPTRSASLPANEPLADLYKGLLSKIFGT